LKYVIEAYKQLEDEKFFNAYFNTLAGTDKLMQQIKDGLTEDEIRESWQSDLDQYKSLRQKYLLYE